MRLTVVLPTYNEASNLPRMAEALLALDLRPPRAEERPGTPELPGAAEPSRVELDLLVVDDSSPDGTGAVADDLALRHPQRIAVLHRPAKQGLAAAYLAGFDTALRSGPDLILQMDCDFSHRPEDVPTLVAAIDDADVVVGSRFIAGGGVDRRWPWYRRGLSRVANGLYRLLLPGVGLRDVTGGFRLWRAATLTGIAPGKRIGAVGYAFQVEMAYLAARLGYRFHEVPIHFDQRAAGRSKLSLAIQLEAAFAPRAIRRRHRRLTPADRCRPPAPTSAAGDA